MKNKKPENIDSLLILLASGFKFRLQLESGHELDRFTVEIINDILKSGMGSCHICTDKDGLFLEVR